MKLFFTKHKHSLILLLITFLAYGFMIPWLGFYWDDWPMAWFAHTLGPTGLIDVLSTDRPFLTGIYMLTTSIIPIKPIYWQIFALLSRWLCGVSAYWALSKIWPDLKKQMFWASILFTVFPGFKQQPISIIYGNGFVLLTSFFLSLGLMVKSFEQTGKKKTISIIGSVFLQIFTIFSTEYYAGLELLRILLIWFKYNLDIRNFKAWFIAMLKNYFPYAIGLFLFFIWRVFIFRFPTYKPVSITELEDSHYPALITFINRMFQDIYLTIWKSWSDVFQFPNLKTINGSSDVFYWVIVLILIPIVFFTAKYLSGKKETIAASISNFQKSEIQVLIFSVSAILLGAFPFWATNLPIQLVYPYDRFFLSLMLGSSLFMIYLLNKFLTGEKTRILALALLVSFSIGAHIDNANSYRREWNVHNDFFWQLTWRIPAIEENTVLLSETFPLSYYSDNSLTAPLNWIYDTTDYHHPLKYMIFFSDIRLGSTLPDLEPGTKIGKGYRSTYFEGTTDQIIGFFYSTDACLRVLDPSISHDDPLIPLSLEEIIDLSDPSRISSIGVENPAKPDESIFGKEPEHGWCYYFQKADLARQNKDWETIVEIEQHLDEYQMSTEVGSEYIPLIEGMAATGNWDKAISYIEKAHARDKTIEKLLCREMTRYQTDYANTKEALTLLQNEMDVIGCKSIIQ